MARGVRKSPVEKMQGELADVQASIAQYESCLETMREKEKALMEHIQLEEFKVVNEMLKERESRLAALRKERRRFRKERIHSNPTAVSPKYAREFEELKKYFEDEGRNATPQ